MTQETKELLLGGILILIFTASLIIWSVKIHERYKEDIKEEIENYVETLPVEVEIYNYSYDEENKAKNGRAVYDIEIYTEEGKVEKHKLILGKEEGTSKGFKYK